jgi:predicted transport protein
MPGGFKDSHLRLNADLAELDTWDEAHIKRRATRLASIALRVWTASELGPEILDRYRKAGPRTATETPRALKDGNYFGHLHGEIQTLFEALRSRILLLDASVREDPKLLYIAYRNATNFVAVEPQKTRLRLMLNLTFDEIHDPLGLCSDVVGAVRWGNGNVQLGMTSLAQLDDVMALVRQSFDKHREEPDE